MHEHNFWLTTTDFPTVPAFPLPSQVDVAILGAGYTGLAAARVLAQAGARVSVFEAQTVGWGASSRNGGMTLTGLKVGLETVLAQYGRDLAHELFAASLAAIDGVEQLVREEGIDCAFARCGHLEVAWKPAHFAAYARAVELMAHEFNHSQVRLIPRAEQRAEIGSDLYHGGLVDDLSAGLNPAQYVAGLARAALRAGAQIFERTPVQAVERVGSTFQVHTATQTIQAQNVLIATSGYTGSATPALQKRIIPIGSYIIATEPLPPALAQELVPHNRMIFDSKNFLYYFRRTPDDRLLFGGRAAFFPESRSAVRDSAEILRRAMVRVYPQLQNTPVAYVWGGTLDFALDRMPHAGVQDGMHYAVGYAGHGVALATYLGTLTARQMLGQPVTNPFATLPFAAVPLYRGQPWFLPLAWAWYQLLDLVG